MKTKTTTAAPNGRRRRKEPLPRRKCENPSRTEVRAVGKWKASVNLNLAGPANPMMRRKVITTGQVNLPADDLFDQVIALLRSGREVRLDSRNGTALRLFPCLNKDYDEMFVAAETMGNFRKSLADIGFTLRHRGVETDPQRECEAKQQRAEELRERRLHVSPDQLVTCPKCGTEFRIGKVLS